LRILVAVCDCCLHFCVVTWLQLDLVSLSSSRATGWKVQVFIHQSDDWLGISSQKWPVIIIILRYAFLSAIRL